MFAGRGFDIPAMLARLSATAAELGLPFGERVMTYNSRRAQELGKWAEGQGLGEEFHLAIFKAYFAHGQNIAQDEVLLDIVDRLGLDRSLATRVLADGTYRAAVDADWHRCREMGVTAVPTFQLNGEQIVGAQPYAALKKMLMGQNIPLR